MPEKYLIHYGIKGMKWGKRRFQNKDGSLTPAGRTRYGDDGDDKPHGDLGLKNRARYKPDPKHGYKIDNRVVSFMGSNRQNVRSGAQNGHPAMNSAMKDPKGPGYNPGGGGYQSLYSDYRKTDPDKKLSEQDKNFSSTTVKKQQSDRPRQAPGSETVHNTANPRDIQYRTNPERYGTFERGTHHGSYMNVTGLFNDRNGRYERDWESQKKRGLSSSKSGIADTHAMYEKLALQGYTNMPFTPYADGQNYKIQGSGGELYRDTVTGKQIMVPYGNNKRDNSGSSSENNPARYGNFEQQRKDAANDSGYSILRRYHGGKDGFSGAFYKEGKYRVPALDASNNLGRGGEVYVNSQTGKETLLKPYGENGSRWTGKETSASSSRNNPARYGNFEQQKRDAARASKSKAGTKKSSLTTKAKQTISQATQQASQSVQKASDWLKKLFGKK